MTGAGPHFIAISVLALKEGELSMLASLIVVSSLMQFALAAWLPLLRRIITPVVSGTAIMLIAVTVMSIAFDRLKEVPEGVPLAAGIVSAAVTLTVAVALALRASGIWRLWSPLIGIAAGCAVAAYFGLYDAQRVIEAPWFDLPDIAVWAGLDLRPGAEFWALLPVFVIVSLVVAIKTSGDSVVIQQISRRRPQATDFRLVQGTLNTNGLGALLSGIAGTLPTIIYSPSCVSLITLTGVAARNVGYIIGGHLIRTGVLAQDRGYPAHNSQSRHGGFPVDDNGSALRGRYEDSLSGRSRSSKGSGGGPGTLNRSGPGESEHPPGPAGPDVGRVTRQRHDSRRSGCDSDDLIHRVDQPAAQTPGDRVGHLRSAQD